jgi:hypothetical protein
VARVTYEGRARDGRYVDDLLMAGKLVPRLLN